MSTNDKTHPAKAAPAGEVQAVRCVEASRLFAGARELHIVHSGEIYRLTITRNGKLILTK